MVKEYEESRKDTTKKIVSGFRNMKEFNIPALSQAQALMMIDVESYAREHQVGKLDIAFVVLEAPIHDIQEEL